jgi:hypothetical protein
MVQTSTAGFPRWKKEFALAIGCIAAGLLLLPLAVYWVGQQAVGEYAPDLGPLDLLMHVWRDTGHGGPLALWLVLSPYLLLQLLRFARKLWRSGSVKPVTNSTPGA